MDKTVEQLQREEIERQVLERVAQRIEQLAGSEVYERAWKRAVEIVRSMKP
jgi:hypothetical protein